MPRVALAVVGLMSGLGRAGPPQAVARGEQDVFAWTRVSSLAALAAGTADSLGPRPVLERATIVALGLPVEAAPATDWQRPLVVALLDPQKFGAPGSGRSLIALVPVQS